MTLVTLLGLAGALAVAPSNPEPPVCSARWSDDRGMIEVMLEGEGPYDRTRIFTAPVNGYAFEMLIFNLYSEPASAIADFIVIGEPGEFERIDRATLVIPGGRSDPTGSPDDQRIHWRFPQTDLFERFVLRGEIQGLEVLPVVRDAYQIDLRRASRQAANFLAEDGAAVAASLRRRFEQGECVALVDAG